MEKSLIHRHVGRRPETFNKWFEAQYGTPPSQQTLADLRRQLHDAEGVVAALRMTVEAVSAYQERRDAALKAWRAREDIIRSNLADQGHA